MELEVATAPTATRLSSLPDGVLSFVLSCLFARDEFRDTRTPWMKPGQAWPSWDVIQFASVCKEWHALLQEVFSANALSLFSVSLTKLSRSSVMELRRQLTLRCAHTQRLNVQRAPTSDLVEGLLHHHDGVALWASLLCHAPHTTIVDLTTDDDTLRTYPIQFLLAAAHSLPRVHSLHVPQYQFRRRYTDPLEIMMDALMRALEVWHSRGQQGGLRVMRFSRSLHMNDYERAERMVETLTKFCPNLESLEDEERHTGWFSDQWHLDLKSWTLFCQSCTNLVEFDWGRVPFATLFFEIFGQFTKPRLTKLTLGAVDTWDWDIYMRDAPTTDGMFLKALGFGTAARNAGAVLKACPNLRELRID